MFDLSTLNSTLLFWTLQWISSLWVAAGLVVLDPAAHHSAACNYRKNKDHPSLGLTRIKKVTRKRSQWCFPIDHQRLRKSFISSCQGRRWPSCCSTVICMVNSARHQCSSQEDNDRNCIRLFRRAFLSMGELKESYGMQWSSLRLAFIVFSGPIV